MRTKSFVAMILAILLATLLGACDSDVTIHEPGVYKGGDDPVASRSAADQRSEALRNRANRAFTDRD